MCKKPFTYCTITATLNTPFALFAALHFNRSVKIYLQIILLAKTLRIVLGLLNAIAIIPSLRVDIRSKKGSCGSWESVTVGKVHDAQT